MNNNRIIQGSSLGVLQIQLEFENSDDSWTNARIRFSHVSCKRLALPLVKRHPAWSSDSLDDLVAEGLGATPLADAGQAEGVTAGGQDTKPAVRRVHLLNHYLHTDGAHLEARTGIEGRQS